MDVVELFISSDRIHVGIETASRFYPVSAESHSLPFCQRLNDFNILLIHVFDRELYSSLIAVEVIVES